MRKDLTNEPKVILAVTLIFISFLFASCCGKQDNKDSVPAKFDLDSATVRLSYIPRDIIQYNGGYLCRISPYHDDSLQLIFLDKHFHVDYSYSSKLNLGLKKGVSAIWTSGDTLFAVHGLGNYDIQYWIKNKWTIKISGITTKENYMHHEKNIPIYEDNKFVVSACSRGEFGGAVFFTEKKTNKTYSCMSSSLVGIHKFGGSYYIASSLAHMSGHSSIVKVEDPKKLYEIKKESELLDCSWYDIYSDDPKDNEIRHPKGYDKGYDILIDSFDLLILGSLEHKNHLYYIYSNWEKTFIGHLNNGKLQALDTIYEKPMWLSEIRDLKHNPSIFPVRSRQMNGVIICEDNKIRIVEFRNE